MILNKYKINSYLVSTGFHILLLILFFFIKFTIEYKQTDYLELGFGGVGTDVGPVQESTKEEQTKEVNKEVKEVELPKAKNTEEENIITQAEKTKEKENVETQAEKVKDVKNPSETSKSVIGAGNEGQAGFGYDIDFGGKGIRKIYSYVIPQYPEGVAKEIDVKLKFTILPDGTVGNILPLIKADSRLENAAINSLRQWRFEPLPQGKKQFEQTAVIVFPFRLN
jgi:TonB family protein